MARHFYPKFISLSMMLCLSIGLSASCSSSDDMPPGVIAPTLSSITPDKSVIAGGTQVTISGSGFATGAQVSFAGIPVATVSEQSSLLIVTVPAYTGPLGPVEVVVQNPDGGQVAKSDLFSYVRIPLLFAPLMARAVGKQPSSIVAEDVNGDGGRELVVANSGDNSVTVLLHNQDYQALGNPYPTATNPSSITIADINGDGQKDLLVACNNANGQDLSIMRGSGNGAFLAPVNLAIGTSVSSVAAQDFNGDGKMDIAVSVRSQGKAYVLLNTSPGANVSFATPYMGFDIGMEPVGLVAADLTGDGRPDVVTANYRDNQIGALVNMNTGTLTAAFQTPAKVAWVGTGPLALAVGELTGDNHPDVVVTNFDNNTISILKGQGDGTFISVSTLMTLEKPRAVALADMDQDGNQDIILANSGANQISIFLGKGNGMFEPAQSFQVGQQPWSLAVADLDLDGRPDVATANLAGGDVSILYNRTLP